ncbi:hypothetical protein [Mycolicibacterium sp. J2]|uniref:hypothetical protein n=1 Tax=Mycolicibacterium sp. J2 TaxID=2993511 RepID=UPI00224B3E55|nr:hypothetical protein [Mycolicibacterium sp. J2]MCX2712372.1 hypothetical protein [Mycolicibacterium sp. J2]
MTSPLEKPEGLSWDAASVELPPMPTIPPGADAMSMTIAAVLPTLEASLTANVSAVAAKENMFSGKVGAAQSAYQNADEAGGQSVGQLGSMLGQMGQMSQLAQTPMQAAGSLGGQTGSFGSMMQQAMGSAGQGGGSGSGAGGAGGLGSLGSQLAGQIPQDQGRPEDREQLDQREQQLNERQSQQDQRQTEQDQREHQLDQRQAQQDARDAVPQHGAAGPAPGAAGPAPVSPHEHGRPSGGEDLSRRV